MSILSSLMEASAAQAAAQAEIAKRSKGKTKEQKKVIEFFYGMSSGCGCLSKWTGMSMSDYLKAVEARCRAVDTRANAIRMIGLDESQIQEIPPLMLASFVYDDDALVKIEDNVAASSQYSITWIFFSATQIYTYKYIFDMTSDNTWEITNDFFYNDITCFSTCHAVKEKIDVTANTGCSGGGCLSSESIRKNNYVVDEFEIIVPGTKYTCSMRNNDTVMQSIQAAKAMLRERKFKI